MKGEVSHHLLGLGAVKLKMVDVKLVHKVSPSEK